MSASPVELHPGEPLKLVVRKGVIQHLPDPSIARPDPRRRFVLREAIRVFDDTHEDLFRVFTIPQGFQTDLASIPRALWAFLDDTELGLIAPIVHDYIYQYGGIPSYRGSQSAGFLYTRKQADHLFKELMKADGVEAWKWRAAYAAVRLFGAPHFND